jgi:hypothetical protein
VRIARANTKAINYACKNFHYSKSVPAVQYGYNVYNDNDEWCGVILYGGGANNNMPKSFGKNAGEVLELVRVALNGKQETTSKAVAMSLKQLHKDNPLCQIVVSYADHRQNIWELFIKRQTGFMLEKQLQATRSIFIKASGRMKEQ